MSIKRFALIGASGYVAPRHVKAIKATGNSLVAATDPHDNVGYLDGYYPNAAFFIAFERFDRYMDKLKNQNKGIDFVLSSLIDELKTTMRLSGISSLEKIKSNELLKPIGILILHRNKNEIDSYLNNFNIIEKKKYGISKIIFFSF